MAVRTGVRRSCRQVVCLGWKGLEQVITVVVLAAVQIVAANCWAATSAKRVTSQMQKLTANNALRPLASDIDAGHAASELKATPLGATDYEAVHYKLVAHKWQLQFLEETGIGGPFALLDDKRLLFVTRCGRLAVVEMRGEDLVLKQRALLPFSAEIHCDGGPEKNLSGVKGLLLSAAKDDEKRTVYLSYSHEPMPGCTTLKLVRFGISLGTQIHIGEKTDLFISSPCGPTPVIHNELGGALAESVGHIYLSVGDFGHLRQRGTRSDFGRIYRFSAASDRPRPQLFAEGLRNALGLTFAPVAEARSSRATALFATDMGPKGGDEINLISRGDNLGFPQSSYGIEYGHDTRRDYAGQFDQHRFGKRPVHVFMPAVAPTGIVYYDKPMFKSWERSLFVTTLRGRSLYRLRLDGKRVVYAEPVATTGDRMRSIQVAPDGSIIAKADPDVLIRFVRAPTAGN